MIENKDTQEENKNSHRFNPETMKGCSCGMSNLEMMTQGRFCGTVSEEGEIDNTQEEETSCCK